MLISQMSIALNTVHLSISTYILKGRFTLQTLQKRSDIPQEYTWNLESIFSTDENWERDFQTLQSRLPELEGLKGTLAQSGQALLTVLQKRDAISKALQRLYVYASM